MNRYIIYNKYHIGGIDMSMKLNAITIEGMHRVDKKRYSFDHNSYLYGPNGAGKSTVLQAIQLAILGYIPGTNKSKEAIFSHANGRTLAVTAELSTDSGEAVTIFRSWTRSGSTIHSICDVTPRGYNIDHIVADLELPVFNFSEFIGMTANKLKDWFISFLPNIGLDIDWKETLLSSINHITSVDNIMDTSLLPEILSYVDASEYSGVEKIRDMNEHLKQLLQYKKAELQRVQSTVSTLIYHDDVPDISDVSSLRRELEVARIAAQKATEYEAAERLVQKARRDIEALQCSAASIEDDAEYVEILKQISNYDTEIQKIKAQQIDISKRISELQGQISEKQKVVAGKGICPYTSENCEHIQTVLERYVEEIQAFSKEAEDLRKTLDNLLSEEQRISTDLYPLYKQRDALIAKYRNYDTLKNVIDSNSLGSAPLKSSEEWLKESNRLSDMIAKATANERYSQLIDTFTSDKYKIEQAIEILKTWVKLTDANGLQTTAMETPFREFSETLSLDLQKLFGSTDLQAEFYLTTKVNSFSFGIRRDDKYIPFDLLSSGEKCLYTLALMISIVRNSNSPLKLILIDDLLDHLDDKNASYLFESLLTIEDVQLIFAGVKRCEKSDVVIEVN